MNEIEKRSTDLKSKEAYLAEIDKLDKELHGPIGELEQARQQIADLEQQNKDLAVRHAALLTQNVQQEEEITNLERQVCGMRGTLEVIASTENGDFWKMRKWCEKRGLYIGDLSDERAWVAVAKKALASVPKCRHEEEKARADMLHDLLRLSQEKLVVGEAGGRLLKAVQEKTEAQLIQAREALVAILDICHDRRAFVMQGPRAFAKAEQIAAKALSQTEGK